MTDEKEGLSVLPPSERQEVDTLLERLGLGQLKRLLALIGRQYEPLLAGRRTVCLAGPVNTGKSSLYNALVGPAAPQAEVSPVPGTTRRPLRGDAGAFWVVDTPGANEAALGAEGQQAGAERHAAAIASAREADLIVAVFDAGHGIAQDEVQVYRKLTALGRPTLVVLNKIDLVRADQEAVVQAAARSLGLAPEAIIPTSATRRINLASLLVAIVRTDPGLLATLAERAPASRWLLAGNTILGACVAAGTANLITSPVPIPFASFVPITSIQIAMVLNLARIFGCRLTPARAREVLFAVGSGFLGRTLFYQLVDLVPVAGPVLGTAIAAGTTMALGYSVAAWFAYGERPSRQALKALSESLSRALAESLRRFPSPQAVRQNLAASVQTVLERIEELRPSPSGPERGPDQEDNG